MATYPALSVTDLASFSGRDASSYPSSGYVAVALTQSALLFKIATCRSEFPDDAIGAELARMAILAMADAIVLSQPYQQVLSNPFSSESIGSYSYSKAANVIASGLPVGIGWFDIAVSQLGVCDLVQGFPTGGGIEVFEQDAYFTSGSRENNVRMLSPQDLNAHRYWATDPSPDQTSNVGNVFSQPSESDGVSWVEDPNNPGIYHWEGEGYVPQPE